MKKTGAVAVVGLTFLILLAGLVCAKSVTFEYPQNVNAGQIFSVNVTLIDYSADVYDIKIDILNFSSSRLSEIYNGSSWVSTTYYVNDIIDASVSNFGSFSMNITELKNDTGNMTVRVRDSAESSDSYYNYLMNITYLPAQQPQNTTNSTSDDEDNEISIEISWDEEEIVNGEEFDIDVDFENLESKDYDVKVFIYDDDQNSPISEIYNTIEEEWQSSYSYIEEIVSGSGDKSETFSLRIKSSESGFYGDAKIKVRIRDSLGTITDSDSEDIEILEAEDDSDGGEDGETAENETVSAQSASGAIRLGRSAETSLQNNSKKGVDGESRGSIIYKSKNEYIREYAVYGFGILCIAIIILLLIDRK